MIWKLFRVLQKKKEKEKSVLFFRATVYNDLLVSTRCLKRRKIPIKLLTWVSFQQQEIKGVELKAWDGLLQKMVCVGKSSPGGYS